MQRRVEMHPVKGLDVSKEKSNSSIFVKGNPYGKSFSIQHTREELESFLQFLKDVEKQAVFGIILKKRQQLQFWRRWEQI
jgi:hypothetical protein